MELREAKQVLSKGDRYENRDHAFGDREIIWKDEKGEEIGGGYCGDGTCTVTVNDESGKISGEFSGKEAEELVGLGKKAIIGRNDTTGPDDYVEGRVMPALTLEAVREELEHRNVFEHGDDEEV